MSYKPVRITTPEQYTELKKWFLFLFDNDLQEECEYCKWWLAVDSSFFYCYYDSSSHPIRNGRIHSMCASCWHEDGEKTDTNNNVLFPILLRYDRTQDKYTSTK
jgi:hypothetical protein